MKLYVKKMCPVMFSCHYRKSVCFVNLAETDFKRHPKFFLSGNIPVSLSLINHSLSFIVNRYHHFEGKVLKRQINNKLYQLYFKYC